MGEKQFVWLQVLDASVRVSSAQLQPFGTWNEFTRFSASFGQVLKADSTSILISAVKVISNGASESEFPVLESPTRVSVAPCEDNEMCGASVAADSSWVVTGYWGSYVGVGTHFARLEFPNLSLGKGGVAFAHAGKEAQFLYVGGDDADRGLLPKGILHFSQHDAFYESQEFVKPARYMVWQKKSVNQGFRKDAVFSWHILRKNRARFVERDAYSSFVYSGKLPRVIPKNWVAWERQVSFPALVEPKNSLNWEQQNTDPWWWPKAIHAAEAMQFAAQHNLLSRRVVVGLVDSGAQKEHPWLAHSFFEKPGEIPDNGLDDDQNGFVDDVFGYDFVRESAAIIDLFGHGTHVAGLVSAHNPQTSEPVALNGNVQIRIGRALDSVGKSNSIDLARAVVYLVNDGVDILNCSWGGGPVTQTLRDAFAYATDSGVLVLSSAGNDRMDTDKNPQVPKMFPGVVSVGAYTENGTKASFSNWGKNSVHWMTPGNNIMSTLPGGVVGTMSGTSMASPIAANIAAFVYGIIAIQHPTVSKATLVQLTKQAVCASGSSGSSDELKKISACGRIDALAAVKSLVQQ